MADDVQMEDAFNAFNKTSKGKGRQTEGDLRNDDLPWYVNLISSLLDPFDGPRVEKYRPITLDDVVSHKDITTTSTRCSPGLPLIAKRV